MIFHLIFMVLYMTTINTFLIDYTVCFSKFLLLGKIDNRGSRYCRWQKKTLSENQQNSNQTRKRKTSTNNCWMGWLHQSTHQNSSKARHSVHRQKWDVAFRRISIKRAVRQHEFEFSDDCQSALEATCSPSNPSGFHLWCFCG